MMRLGQEVVATNSTPFFRCRTRLSLRKMKMGVELHRKSAEARISDIFEPKILLRAVKGNIYLGWRLGFCFYGELDVAKKG